MEPKVGDKKEVEECDSCCYGPVEATYTENGHPKKGAWFCDVCAETFVGNVFFWPRQYENGQLYKSLAIGINMILKEIRGMK